MPDPTPQQLIADPRFHALPIGDRISALAGIDPDFAKLNPAQRIQAMTGISGDQPAPAQPQKLTDVPDQPGLQLASAWEHLKGIMSDAYKTTIPGQINQGATNIQQYIQGKVAQRNQQNQVSASQGQQQPNSNGVTSALGMAGDTAGLVAGASSPTGLATIGGAMAAPIPAAIAGIGYGGYQAVKNAPDLANLAVTGQANPQNVQQGLMGLATAVGSAAGLKASITPKSPLPNETAAQVLTDTVNPPAREQAKFEADVNKSLPDVMAGKQIDPANPRASVADIFQEAGGRYKTEYDALKQPLTEADAARVDQMEARLKVINNTLKPLYDKRVGQTSASLTNEQHVALTNEAQGIRANLNDLLGKANGIAPEDVSAARQKYGRAYDVADEINYQLAEERYRANEFANNPTWEGLKNRMVQSGAKATMGPDARFLRAFKNYQGSPDATPNQNLPTNYQNQGAFPRSADWQVNPQQSQQLPSTDYSPDIPSAVHEALGSMARRSAMRPTPPVKVMSEAQKAAIQQALQNRSQR